MANLPPGVRPIYTDIRDLPADAVAPYLRNAFQRAVEESDPDLDRFLVLGRKARAVEPDAVNTVLGEWLAGEPNPSRSGIAANFLAGYWTHETNVPEPLLALVLKHLKVVADRRDISELLLFAIDAVYPAASAPLKQAIRETFQDVSARLRDRPLQGFAATALNRVLTS